MLSGTMLMENVTAYLLVLFSFQLYEHNSGKKRATWESVILAVLAQMTYFRFFYAKLMENMYSDAFIGVLVVYYVGLIPMSIVGTLLAGFRKKWFVIVAMTSVVANIALIMISTYFAV